jgi:urease accessory protein
MSDVSNGAISPAIRTQTFTGSGLAILRSHGNVDKPSSSFTHLSSTFPLKLISPRTSSKDANLRIARQDATSDAKSVAALYVVGYGGGLVSGDKVSIDFDVGQRCTLLVLTQGSTKVFKIRGSNTIDPSEASVTSQTFRCIIQKGATLVVLPDPVTCFADSRYQQTQQFDLRCKVTSSLILLDWFTPGRQHLASKAGEAAINETWAFESYQSRNEIRLGQQVIARDISALERSSSNSIAEKCESYTCFATLFLVGIDVVGIVDTIRSDFYQIQQGNKQQSNQRVASNVDPVIWSCSTLGRGDDQQDSPGIGVRLAGTSTELVRTWLREKLIAVRQLVGDDLYRQAMGS